MVTFHFQLSFSSCPHIIRACAELYPNLSSPISPQLLYVPAMSKYYLIFCCAPEYCVYFHFWIFVPSAVACSSVYLTPLLWFDSLCSLLLIFTLFFFLSTSSFDPCPASCDWVLPCGFGAGWSLRHPELFLHCFHIAPSVNPFDPPLYLPPFILIPGSYPPKKKKKKCPG